MKISYFTYDVANIATPGHHVRVDLRHLVSKWAAMQAKRLVSVEHGADKLFLLPESGRLYLLVQTREEELARVLSRSNKKAKDLRSALATGDSLGFASYLYLDDHWFALGCRVLSPRSRACEHYLNSMLRSVGLPYLLRMTAVQSSLTTQEARKLKFVSSVRLVVTDTSSFAHDILAALGKTSSKFSAGEIEVRFKPKKPGSNAPLLQSVLSNIPESDMARLHIRAKAAIEDQLGDYFVVGAGKVGDYVDDKPDQVSQHIRAAANSNATLQEALREHEADVEEEPNLPVLLGDLRDRFTATHLPNPLRHVDGVDVVT